MSHQVIKPYVPKHKIRIVTAASLFDGHDVSINTMRRILQSSGAEVIHLGHDRSVEDVVNTAIQEDAHAQTRAGEVYDNTFVRQPLRDLLQAMQACGF